MGGFFLSFSSQFEYDLSQVKVATRLLSISSPDLDSLLGTFLIPGNFLLIYLAVYCFFLPYAPRAESCLTSYYSKNSSMCLSCPRHSIEN